MKKFLKRIATSAILYGLAVAFFLCVKPVFTAIGLSAIFLLIMIFEWPKICNLKKLNCWLLTPIYPILPFVLLIYMGAFQTYRMLLFYMILITCSHDMGGYFIGNIIGKHKLVPDISPKKTWEGFFGGCLFTFILTYLIFIVVNPQISGWQTLGISLSVSVLATIGDLFESWLKRKAGVKDSGTLLPGHGGFLDRFDSIMAVGILFFVLKDYLIKIFVCSS